MIQLNTARLIIRDPQPCDFAGWHNLLSNTQNLRFTHQMQTHSEEESRSRLQSAIDAAHATQRDKWFLCIQPAQTGEFIGSIGCTTKPCHGGLLGGVGWFLLPEYQGKGYATEAFRALIPFLFAHIGVTCIQAGCNASNRASERVMQKGGLTLAKKEGDRLYYQLTKADWEKQNAL